MKLFRCSSCKTVPYPHRAAGPAVPPRTPLPPPLPTAVGVPAARRVKLGPLPAYRQSSRRRRRARSAARRGETQLMRGSSRFRHLRSLGGPPRERRRRRFKFGFFGSPARWAARLSELSAVSRARRWGVPPPHHRSDLTLASGGQPPRCSPVIVAVSLEDCPGKRNRQAARGFRRAASGALLPVHGFLCTTLLPCTTSASGARLPARGAAAGQLLRPPRSRQCHAPQCVRGNLLRKWRLQKTDGASST